MGGLRARDRDRRGVGAAPHATAFTKATQDIINGGDPQDTLDAAVTAIFANLKTNGDYTQK